MRSPSPPEPSPWDRLVRKTKIAATAGEPSAHDTNRATTPTRSQRSRSDSPIPPLSIESKDWVGPARVRLSRRHAVRDLSPEPAEPEQLPEASKEDDKKDDDAEEQIIVAYDQYDLFGNYVPEEDSSSDDSKTQSNESSPERKAKESARAAAWEELFQEDPSDDDTIYYTRRRPSESISPPVARTGTEFTGLGFSSKLRGGFKKRRRAEIKGELVRMDDKHAQDEQSKGIGAEAAASKEEEVATPRGRTRRSSRSPTSNAEDTQSTPTRSSKAASAHSHQPDATRLATPTSSQSSTSQAATIAVNDDEDDSPDQQQPARKPKRRLTLNHDIIRPAPKKRRTTPSTKKKETAVQTTLSLSSGATMVECKVCDTVFNPLHPEDVRVHKKRHVALVRRERAEAFEVERREALERERDRAWEREREKAGALASEMEQ